MTGKEMRAALEAALAPFADTFGGDELERMVDAVEDALRGRESGMATPRDYWFAERIFAGWTAENERLRAALKVVADGDWVEGDPLQVRDAARAALAPKAAS